MERDIRGTKVGSLAMEFEARTPRLRLRCLRDGDAETTAAIMTDAVSRFTASWTTPLSIDAALERIRRVRQEWAAGEGLAFAIERREDGVLIGWTGVRSYSDQPQKGSFGYWLGEAYHGVGYGTEASRAVVRVGFEKLALEIVEAGAQPENVASINIMKKLGMRAIGQRFHFSSARNREELCAFFELHRDELDSTK